MLEPEFRTGVIRPVECFKTAWAMIRNDFLMVFAVVLVGFLIASVLPIVLLGPMMCGIYIALLHLHDYGTIDFDKLFKGFEHFLPGLIVSLIIVVPMLIVVFTVYVPMIVFAVAGPRMNETEIFTFLGLTIAFEFVLAVIMVCIHTLILFAFPLLVDRGVGAVGSIKLSARSVWQNLGGVAGIFGVGFLLSILGYLALCIGIYFVLPVIMMATVVAYRQVFPKLGYGTSGFPPPPNAYSDLR